MLKCGGRTLSPGETGKDCQSHERTADYRVRTLPSGGKDKDCQSHWRKAWAAEWW